ncbi:DUF2007 domain-containing protein [Patescibacteria group bacterium]|nr:DUF2007 domain-containing protein [Patescibacteria group bacterium]
MSSKLVTAALFSTRFEAEVAKLVLDAAGIKSFVSADDAGGMRPAPFSYSPGAELVVREEDFQKAQELLSEKH